MIKKEAAYRAKIFQAYSEGKFVQIRVKGDQIWNTLTYPNGCWDFDTYEFRIKPEFRPYNSIEEFLKAKKEHGPMVRLNESVFATPLSCSILLENIFINFNIPAYDNVSLNTLSKYEWEDGTKCGIYENQ